MPHEVAQYVQQVDTIARTFNCNRRYVYDIIDGGRKTESPKLAAMVSQFTGEPPEAYLIEQAVRIDALEVQDDWCVSRLPEGTALSDFNDLDLLLFWREILKLTAEIKLEMLKRRGSKIDEPEAIASIGTLRDQRRDIVENTVKKYGGNKSKAAKELGMSVRAVRYHLR